MRSTSPVKPVKHELPAMSGPSGTARPLLRRGVVVIASATAVSLLRLESSLQLRSTPCKAMTMKNRSTRGLARLLCTEIAGNTKKSHIQALARPLDVIGNGWRAHIIS